MIGDFFRFWWALFQLNARKTLFRLRRNRGRCPCQSPSDSGRAWETMCEAAALWNQPRRLQWVCPHYKKGPNGWRCAVNTADVRPFWGRAFGFTAASVALMYLVGAFGAFALLTHLGYTTVQPLDTLWPPRWSRIAAARSEYFLERAKAAIARNDEKAMRLCLASASAAAGNHYEARLALAQIYSYLSMRQVASQSFESLLADFPAERGRTAMIYHDVLVAQRHFDLLGDLALAQLASETGPDRTAWLRAAFMALRGSKSPGEILAQSEARLQQLPSAWRDALSAEAAVRAGDRAALKRLEGIPLAASDIPLLILAGESLAEFAPANEAVDEIIRMGPAIGSFEQERLLLRLHVRLGAEQAALKSFDAMLRVAAHAGQRERLLASLVEFPDLRRAERLTSAVSNPRTPFAAAELGALWVAAAAAKNGALGKLAESRLQSQYGIELRPSFPRTLDAKNANLWIRVLPLGREMVCALALK